MNPTMIAEKQRKLAARAENHPKHKFTNLYSLMHWQVWIDTAARNVLARKGSNTAGVDAQTRANFKRKYETNRDQLVTSLKSRNYQPQPVRRVYIPKGNGQRRPLGIPTLKDRIVQEAMRMILDPIYEAEFQWCSYGFRKERQAMDAIAELTTRHNAAGRFYYVIEGDIRSYFDTVHHKKLMKILRQRIADKHLLDLIWQFLKVGIMEGQLFARTERGVPQGGVVSPLLANVYLNEFDRWFEEQYPIARTNRYKKGLKPKQEGRGNYCLIRYADDWVISGNGSYQAILQVKQEVAQFINQELKLELATEKTRITHINDGYDFLGFHIQRVHRRGKWVVYVTPSKKTTAKFKARVKEVTKGKWHWECEAVKLTQLSAMLRGWCNYYRYSSLLRPLVDVAWYVSQRYWIWLRKKYPHMGKHKLLKTNTKKIHRYNRWYTTLRVEGKMKEYYLWMPSKTELERTRYLRKGRIGWQNPYLTEELDTNQPQWAGEPAENTMVWPTAPGRPQEWSELRLKALLRDGNRCVHCDSSDRIEVHHIGKVTTLDLKQVVTLCWSCHRAQHVC